MKRMLSVILTLMLVITMVVPVFADDHISAEDLELEEIVTAEEYTLAPEPLYPFVLVPSKEHMFDDAWGTYEEIEGYLYVKNMETKEIVQISDERVYQVFDDTLDFIYCITEDNQLVQTDYVGRSWRVLYDAQYGELASVWYHAGKLYFIDGEYVCGYDLTSNLAAPLRLVPGVVSVYPCADGTLLLRNENKEYSAFDYRTKSLSAQLDEYEVNALLSADSVAYTAAVDEDLYEITANLTGTDITFPLSDYPHGSYFTTPSGHTTACNHGSSLTSICASYKGSYQCMGFAKMAYDKFAHISANTAFTYPSGDTSTYDYVKFQSDTDVKEYFASMNTGAYVRLSADSKSEDTNDLGTHSIVFVSMAGTRVWTYDANRIGRCQVAYEFRTFSDIRGSYPYRIHHISHHYTTTPVSYSATYHKISCANCVGYILQEHNFVTSQGRTACTECGHVYIAPITP